MNNLFEIFIAVVIESEREPHTISERLQQVVFVSCGQKDGEIRKRNAVGAFAFTAIHHDALLVQCQVECCLEEFRQFVRLVENAPQPVLAHVAVGGRVQGLGIAAGLALGLRLLGRESRVFCILGDGELQEGSIWESAMSASANAQKNLVAIVDRNRVQLDDAVQNIMPLDPLADKWRAFGWTVAECDGHSMEEIGRALATEHHGPLVVIAHTVKGRGVSFMEDSALWHGRAPSDEELSAALEELK